jgi:uncharacterized protein
MNKKSSFSVIIEPTLGCNFRCKHCYECQTNYENSVMDLDVLETIIEKCQKEYQEISYLWFGGEPLLAGHHFFEQIILLQEKYKNENQIIRNSIQTNGSLLDDWFLSFFSNHQFSVSVSYDGDHHNVLRQDQDVVLNHIKEMISQNIPVGIISTIHKFNVNDQIAMYEAFKKLGVNFKFNRIFKSNHLMSERYLIHHQTYTNEMKHFFNLWLNDLEGVDFSPFTDYVKLVLNYPSRSCEHSGCLYKWLSIDPKGDIYPCTRLYESPFNMGNIKDYVYISDSFESESFNQLLSKAILRRKQCQSTCDVYYYCNGACNANSYLETDLSIPFTELCHFNQAFIPFVKNRIHELIQSQIILNPAIKKLIENRPLYENGKFRFDQ